MKNSITMETGRLPWRSPKTFGKAWQLLPSTACNTCTSFCASLRSASFWTDPVLIQRMSKMRLKDNNRDQTIRYHVLSSAVFCQI